MGTKIDIASEVHNALKGHSLLTGVEWVEANEEIVLEFATANYLDKDIELITQEEVNELKEKIEHIKYEFNEENMVCTVILNEDNDYRHITAFDNEYSGVDWEYCIIYLIELGLIKKG